MNDTPHEPQTALAAYQIPDQRISELRTKVDRLAKRAVKLGMAPLVLRAVHSDARRIVKRRPDGSPQILELPCTWCELDGASPVVAGYTFLARLEHTPAGNLVSRAPGSDEVDLVAYRSADPNCDHCHFSRARKDTFVLRAPDGTLKQIGRNCLADYLRSENAEIVVAILALTYEFERSTDDGGEPDEFGGGGGWRAILPVDVYLAASVAAVRQAGWVSRGAVRAYEAAGGHGKQATSDFAAYISGRAPSDRREYAAWREAQPTDADRARAATILAWIVGTTETTDYFWNLRTAAQQPTVTHRMMGILASAVSVYQREVEKIEAAKHAPKASTEYFGEVGKRYDLVGRVTFVREIPGWRDQIKTIVGLESPDGHRFTWFASGARDVEVGQTVDFRGTVKKHELYKDRHQTVLTRCEIKRVHPKEEIAS